MDPIEPANLEMNGLVPQKWHEVFGKVLAKKPDDRYQTAAEFVHDLEYCLGSWFGAIDEHPDRGRGAGDDTDDPSAHARDPARRHLRDAAVRRRSRRPRRVPPPRAARGTTASSLAAAAPAGGHEHRRR